MNKKDPKSNNSNNKIAKYNRIRINKNNNKIISLNMVEKHT